MDIQKVKKIKVDWLGKCPKCERTEHTASTVEGNKSYLYDGDIVECWCGQTGVIDVDSIGSAWCEWNEKPRTIIDDFNDYYREKFPNYWNVLHKNNHQACTHYFDLLNAWQVAKADAVPEILKNDCMISQTWFMKGSPVSALIKHAEDVYKAEAIAQNSKIKFGTDDNEHWFAHDVPFFGRVQIDRIEEHGLVEWDIFFNECWQGPFNTKSKCIRHLEECIKEMHEEAQEQGND